MFGDEALILGRDDWTVHTADPAEIMRLAHGFLPRLDEVQKLAVEQDAREQAELLEDGRQGDRWWRGWDG